jgi:hypothetical protein
VAKQTPPKVNRAADKDGADLHRAAGGEFFVIDRRAFAAASKLGLNPAVAYLTIARGAGSRPTSQWSVNAIERYTGMGRPKANLAIKSLVDGGLLTLERTGRKPVYGIVSAHQLPEVRLSAEERMLLNRIAEESGLRVAREYSGVAADLIRRGFVDKYHGYWFAKHKWDFFSEEPQHVWLPNAIVDGAVEETPPLALLRQMQDVRRLQLFTALYDSNDLPNDGGVPRILLYETHSMTRISEQGACTIWRFGKPSNRASARSSPLLKPYLTGNRIEDGRDAGGPDFWAALSKIERCGLLTFIPHVFESANSDDNFEGEMLHPYPVENGGGEEWECSVANAADAAARVLLTAKQQQWATENKQHFLVAPSHLTPAVIGIARLKYRPQTRKTAAWFAMINARCEAWQTIYESIIRSRDPSMMAKRPKCENVQHKGRDKR